MSEMTTVETMTLDGGNPILDFVNSGYDRQPGVPAERLHQYADLLTLSLRIGFIDQKMVRSLKHEAQIHPLEATAVLEKAKLLRSSFYEICITRINSHDLNLSKQAVEIFNGYLGEALKYSRISVEDETFKKDWRADHYDLEFPLRRLVVFGYELITGPRQAFVKQCAGCAWLFFDKSKNHQRRWCDMKTCGNSEKVKRYYSKQKNVKHSD